MRAQGNKCQISQNDTLHMKCSEFYNVPVFFTIIVKFDIYFLRLPWEIVIGQCYYRWPIVSITLKKCKKECVIVSIIILVQGFCPLKITQFPDGFCP